MNLFGLWCAVSGQKEDGQLDAPCLPGGRCLVTNSYCNQQVCKCLRQYFDKDDQCVPKIPLYGPCSAGEVCLDDNAQCSRDGVCTCLAGASSAGCGAVTSLTVPINIGQETNVMVTLF